MPPAELRGLGGRRLRLGALLINWDPGAHLAARAAWVTELLKSRLAREVRGSPAREPVPAFSSAVDTA